LKSNQNNNEKLKAIVFITKIALLQSADAAAEQQSQRDEIFVIKKM